MSSPIIITANDYHVDQLNNFAQAVYEKYSNQLRGDLEGTCILINTAEKKASHFSDDRMPILLEGSIPEIPDKVKFSILRIDLLKIHANRNDYEVETFGQMDIIGMTMLGRIKCIE